jgi:hypothetical protein
MTQRVHRTFPNIGYLTRQLTAEELSPIWEEISQIKGNFDSAEKFNQDLAGNIKKEFLLINNLTYLENLLLPDAQDFIDRNNYKKESNSKLCLDYSWVNFQTKHEFNPTHSHAGILSFVIWLKIPYSAKEEKNLGPGKDSNTNAPGHFEFLYTDTLGQIKSLLVACDQEMEGTMLMFPASLMHAVYPFYTSDDYRISVSGNFNYTTN